jgi:hypothetical protein
MLINNKTQGVGRGGGGGGGGGLAAAVTAASEVAAAAGGEDDKSALVEVSDEKVKLAVLDRLSHGTFLKCIGFVGKIEKLIEPKIHLPADDGGHWRRRRPRHGQLRNNHFGKRKIMLFFHRYIFRSGRPL